MPGENCRMLLSQLWLESWTKTMSLCMEGLEKAEPVVVCITNKGPCILVPLFSNLTLLHMIPNALMQQSRCIEAL